MKPVNLRTEYFPQPVGLQSRHPRLSWELSPHRRNFHQSAYEIHVATAPDQLDSGTPDQWNSGKIDSNSTVHVPYAGNETRSRATYFWRIRFWDETGEASAWSDIACWEMGLLEASEWQACWIGSPIVGGTHMSPAAPYLRHEFLLTEKPIARARWYVSALGVYEAFINGQKIGDEVFAPGWTDYDRTIQYRVYEVQSALRPGANCLGGWLGDGWYCGYTGNTNCRQFYGDRPYFLAQLEVTFQDGTTQLISTSPDWKTHASPILSSDFFMGEAYDARLELGSWSSPGFDDGHWSPVITKDRTPAVLRFSASPPVRRILELPPVSGPKDFPKPLSEGRYIFDLGQNMVGIPRLKLRGRRGQTITIRYAEILKPDGMIYTDNLRQALCTDYYTFKDENVATYEPHFTFHGFRYLEICGLGYEPGFDAVTGVVLHSDTPDTGEFHCSDPLITQLQKNIQWGQRGNFLEVPTDCPQRNERLGWTGDAQVFIRTASFNMEVAGFFTKWAQDLRDAQREDGRIGPVVPNTQPDPNRDGGPAWVDALMICPWTIYSCYGDQRILEEHYESAKKFIRFLELGAINFIRCHPDGKEARGFGDWLALDGSGKTDGGTPRDLIGTAFFFYSSHLMEKYARVLGRDKDVHYFENLCSKIKAAFCHRFLTADNLLIGQTQTAHVLALHFDLVPESSRPFLIQWLVNDIKERGNHLATGFVGTPYLAHVLADNGHLDLAYALLNQKTWPSWLYAVTQGATTIWERWDGWTHDRGFQDPGMNSFNHYAYGAIGEWLYETVAGLKSDPDHAGYKHIVFRPRPGGGLHHAHASVKTVYGTAASSWRIEGDRFIWTINVPPNTTATIGVPAKLNEPVTESGRPASESEGVQALGWSNDTARYTVGSGLFHFTSTLP